MPDESDGFKERTRLPAARERLRETLAPHGRTERVPLESADGRVLAADVEALRDVPHYERAAMDGFAVRAADTFDANRESPAVLSVTDGAVAEAGDAVAEAGAVRVHTGSPVPDGADAVVPVERVERRGDAIEVFDPVPEGDNVAPVGEDVAEGRHCYDAGHRLRPSDLGLLKAVGIAEVAVAERPTVGVIPTGEELVQSDPAPGEVIETNGLTVSTLVERWGGRAAYRDVVSDYRAALRSAIEADLTKDVVVATGGTSVGERDLVPDIVDALGEVVVHGLAIRPGHPAGFGVVQETPVIMLPGSPVSTIVGAVQFLRPALAWLAGAEPAPLPRRPVTLGRKVPSEPGVRTFARVEVERGMGGELRATPTTTGGAGILSSVALADGWVVVPESREGIPSGETVHVQDWEWSP